MIFFTTSASKYLSQRPLTNVEYLKYAIKRKKSISRGVVVRDNLPKKLRNREIGIVKPHTRKFILYFNKIVKLKVLNARSPFELIKYFN